MQVGVLHDFTFDKSSCSWQPWIDSSAAPSIAESLSFNEVIVPTVDTARCRQLMKLLVTHNKHLLFVGPTGEAACASGAATASVSNLNFREGILGFASLPHGLRLCTH